MRGPGVMVNVTVCQPEPIFSYKLVEMAIPTNPKPTIYRNVYVNTGPQVGVHIQLSVFFQRNTPKASILWETIYSLAQIPDSNDE